MAFTLKVLSIAKKDMSEAKKWYEKNQTGLGEELKQNVNAAIEFAGQNPYHFQKRYKEFRLLSVKRFPYIVYFLIDEEREMVIIFGILHMSRDPEIARKRVSF